MTLAEFKKEILNCISICEREIHDRKKGIEGESSLVQLEQTILPELKQLLQNVENDTISSTERYLLSFANAFTVWGWDIQRPGELFICLSKLNNHYKTI